MASFTPPALQEVSLPLLLRRVFFSKLFFHNCRCCFQFKNGKPDLILAEFCICWRRSVKRCALTVGLALASHSSKPLTYPKQVRRPRTTVPTALIWILILSVLPKERVRSVMATDNWQRTCGTLLSRRFIKVWPKLPPRYVPVTDYWCANLPPRWRRLCWRSHWVHQQTQRNGRANTPTCTYLPTLIILAWQTHTWGEKKKPTMLQERDGKQWNVWGINDLTGNIEGQMLRVINWGCVHKGQQEQTRSRQEYLNVGFASVTVLFFSLYVEQSDRTCRRRWTHWWRNFVKESDVTSKRNSYLNQRKEKGLVITIPLSAFQTH